MNSLLNLESSSILKRKYLISIDYIILIIMLLIPLISSTSFNLFQIFLETFLTFFFILGIVKMKINKDDFILLFSFIFFSLISLMNNDITVFLLNFKIYLLCIFTLIYFKNKNFFPRRIIYFFLLINILYSVLTEIFGIWILESQSFFVSQKAYLFSRPAGFFGSPHATSNFMALILIYLFYVEKNRILQLIIFFSLFLYSSWTAVIALLMNIIYIMIKRYFINLNPIIFFITITFISFSFIELILSIISEIENSRFYSLEIILPQYFDTKYYENVINFYPKSYSQFIDYQESTFANVGNEIGFIKLFVEAGFPLAIFLLYSIIKRTKHLSVFFLFTMMHYSFFTISPIILYLAMILNHRIEKFDKHK